MYCPVCGKQQVSDETRFCSGCGFPLTGVAEVISNGGASLQAFSGNRSKKDSPRKRGIKQGVMILLLGCCFILPITAILMAFLGFPAFIVAITAILSFMGGILRIVYAFMFESNEQELELESVNFKSENFEFSLKKPSDQNALPPQTSIPVSDLQMPQAGSWRDSEELQPTSVIEDTTKLLNKDK